MRFFSRKENKNAWRGEVLKEAILESNLEQLEELLKKELPPNVHNMSLKEAFFTLEQRRMGIGGLDDSTIYSHLLNQKDPISGQTLLEFAVRSLNVKTVELLLKYGAWPYSLYLEGQKNIFHILMQIAAQSKKYTEISKQIESIAILLFSYGYLELIPDEDQVPFFIPMKDSPQKIFHQKQLFNDWKKQASEKKQKRWNDYAMEIPEYDLLPKIQQAVTPLLQSKVNYGGSRLPGLLTKYISKEKQESKINEILQDIFYQALQWGSYEVFSDLMLFLDEYPSVVPLYMNKNIYSVDSYYFSELNWLDYFVKFPNDFDDLFNVRLQQRYQLTAPDYETLYVLYNEKKLTLDQYTQIRQQFGASINHLPSITALLDFYKLQSRKLQGEQAEIFSNSYAMEFAALSGDSEEPINSATPYKILDHFSQKLADLQTTINYQMDHTETLLLLREEELILIEKIIADLRTLPIVIHSAYRALHVCPYGQLKGFTETVALENKLFSSFFENCSYFDGNKRHPEFFGLSFFEYFYSVIKGQQKKLLDESDKSGLTYDSIMAITNTSITEFQLCVSAQRDPKIISSKKHGEEIKNLLDWEQVWVCRPCTYEERPKIIRPLLPPCQVTIDGKINTLFDSARSGNIAELEANLHSYFQLNPEKIDDFRQKKYDLLVSNVSNKTEWIEKIEDELGGTIFYVKKDGIGTLLELALKKQNYNLIKLLLEYGAPLTDRYNGQTALEFFLSYKPLETEIENYKNIFVLLIKHGALEAWKIKRGPVFSPNAAHCFAESYLKEFYAILPAFYSEEHIIKYIETLIHRGIEEWKNEVTQAYQLGHPNHLQNPSYELNSLLDVHNWVWEKHSAQEEKKYHQEEERRLSQADKKEKEKQKKIAEQKKKEVEKLNRKKIPEEQKNYNNVAEIGQINKKTGWMFPIVLIY